MLRAGLLIGLLVICEVAISRPAIRARAETGPARVVLYATCVLLIALFGTFDGSQFIYFQF